MAAITKPMPAYLRCDGCKKLTRVDLLDDRGPQTLCDQCYGEGWMPLIASWARVTEPAAHKEG